MAAYGNIHSQLAINHNSGNAKGRPIDLFKELAILVEQSFGHGIKKKRNMVNNNSSSYMMQLLEDKKA